MGVRARDKGLSFFRSVIKRDINEFVIPNNNKRYLLFELSFFEQEYPPHFRIINMNFGRN